LTSKILDMARKAIVTFTARGFDDIVDEGGSQAWRLDLNRAYHAEYLVCVQNRRVGSLGDGSAPSAPHGEAFLIGHIRAIVPLPSWPERWMIKIDDYASISMPNVWRGGIIPIRYMTLEDIGIGSLIVEEAKQKLADAYSVPPEAVRIKIEL
jgi:hypothetical protein